MTPQVVGRCPDCGTDIPRDHTYRCPNDDCGVDLAGVDLLPLAGGVQ